LAKSRWRVKTTMPQENFYWVNIRDKPTD
jgi:hypothetical protein